MGSLCSEVFDSVEDINNAFCFHPLNSCTQGTESSSPTDTSTEEREKLVEGECGSIIMVPPFLSLIMNLS